MILSFTRYILNIYLICFVTLANASSTSCLSESIRNLLKPYTQKDLSDIVILNSSSNRGYFSLDEQYDPNSIYIGVANRRTEGSHHYYLVAGGRGFDGIPLYHPAKVKEFKKSPFFTKGVLFQITENDDLASIVSNSIEQNRASRNLTCLHGVCRILEEVEIDIPKYRNESSIISAEEFSQSLMSANVTVGGRPAKVRMIASSTQELEHYLNRLKSVDSNARLEISFGVGIYTTFALSIGGITVYALVEIINTHS